MANWIFFSHAARASALLFGFFFFFILHSPFCLSSDWPQLACTPQRTGRTEDQPPIHTMGVKWIAVMENDRFQEDMAVTYGAQPVVYEDIVIACTRAGNVFAFDASTGAAKWRYECGAPIMGTPAAGHGKVFIGDLGGALRALDSKTGEKAWAFGAGGSISCSMLLAENKLFFSDQPGRFYALDAQSGALLWSFDAQAPIRHTAAYDNGRVFFGDENMFAHCLDADTGKPLWKSEKLYGQSFLYSYPVCHKGKVVFRSMPLFQRSVAHFEKAAQLKYPEMEELVNIMESFGVSQSEIARLPEQQASVVGWYEEHKWFQETFVFDQETGVQPYVPGIVYTAAGSGGSGVSAMPVVGSDGLMYLLQGLSPNIGGGAPMAIAAFDIDIGRIVTYVVAPGPDAPDLGKDYDPDNTRGYPGPMVRNLDGSYATDRFVELTTDEPFLLSMGGDVLFAAIQGTGLLNLKTREAVMGGHGLAPTTLVQTRQEKTSFGKLITDFPRHSTGRGYMPEQAWYVISGDMCFTYITGHTSRNTGMGAWLIAMEGVE